MTQQSSDNCPSLGLLSSTDFFFTTRIVDTARALDREVQVVKGLEVFEKTLREQPVGLWIIDLDNSASILGEVERVREQHPELMVLAFGSHVEVDLLKRARAAGCQQVVPRSKFTTELATWLKEYLKPRSAST